MEFFDELNKILDYADENPVSCEEFADAVETLYDLSLMLEEADADDDPDELVEDAKLEISDIIEELEGVKGVQTLVKMLKALL